MSQQYEKRPLSNAFKFEIQTVCLTTHSVLRPSRALPPPLSSPRRPINVIVHAHLPSRRLSHLHFFFVLDFKLSTARSLSFSLFILSLSRTLAFPLCSPSRFSLSSLPLQLVVLKFLSSPSYPTLLSVSCVSLFLARSSKEEFHRKKIKLSRRARGQERSADEFHSAFPRFS